MSKLLGFLNKKTYIKHTKKYDFSQIFWSESLNYHEHLEQIAHDSHLSWATWAICSGLLFWYERPEWFPHSRSFVLSNLSEWLTVAHLIWANSQPFNLLCQPSLLIIYVHTLIQYSGRPQNGNSNHRESSLEGPSAVHSCLCGRCLLVSTWFTF